VHRQPGLTGRQLPLQAGRNTIGRDATRCQVTLDDPMVSNEHAAIVFEHGRFVLQDLASTNGTYLNGQRILRQMLFDNDEIRLGNSVLVFKQV
jgi:pSer/pThr/pTyr-binding forkhead associated (FHA) protein